MLPYAPLVYEYRGDTPDLIHYGYLCIVDEHSNILFHIGDPDVMVFYRSASKPIQALPVIAHGLDVRYGLTPEETTIFAGSHAGEPYHIAALESIMKKAGFSEDMLVMKPAVPAHTASNEARIRAGLPPRKFYHNCAGKHAALMMVQRELGGKPEDYWKIGALAQQEVEQTIKILSETDTVRIGVDGCGVPVFAVSLRHIAAASKNLACIDTIRDGRLQRAAAAFVPRIHQYPHMMRGTGYLCTLLNYDADIVAKGGANGVYAFGLKKERLGVAFKLIDGTEATWPFIVLQVLKDLDCLRKETEERIESLHPVFIRNDNDVEVGRREAAFTVKL